MKVRVSSLGPHTSERDFVLVGDEVHVWQFDLDAGTPSIGALDPAEQERAGRFRFAQDRQRFVCRRTLLRQLLGRYLRQPAAHVELVTGPHGKPRLADDSLQFNASAADALGLCAVTRRRPLGVDIERVRPFPWEEIAATLFHPAELARIKQAAAPEQAALFFRCWTAHEAIVKADGGGLTHPLAAVDCSLLMEGDWAHLVDSRCTGWDCINLLPRAGWVATLAVESS